MLLQAKDLKKYFLLENGIFRPGKKVIKAVDGISFDLPEGGVLGIVGESGSGKSTLAKLILKLLKPTSGEIIFGPEIKDLRKEAGIIFQDPLLSLNPRMKIEDILLEPFIIQRKKKSPNKLKETIELINLEKGVLNRYPAQLSGGQRQRVCIARALMIEPKLLVLDEPLSSLDLIIQKQILDLLIRLKDRFRMTYVFISHNIAVVKYISDQIAVMLDGKAVEHGKTNEVLKNPCAPYTKKLLEAAK